MWIYYDRNMALKFGQLQVGRIVQVFMNIDMMIGNRKFEFGDELS